MDVKSKYGLPEDAELVKLLYEDGGEDMRLTRSKAARVEFLTNTRVMEQMVSPPARILDIGAGTGVYSIHLAQRGYDVCALELAEANVAVFREKLRPDMKIDLRQGNALDLSAYADHSFDAVLVMGPLYHLHDEADQLCCIAEARRVCKPGGLIFFAFLSNDMIILTEFAYRPHFFAEDSYDHESFKLDDVPFVFFTVEKARALLRKGGMEIVREIASDGVSELMAEKINALDEAEYAQYLRYHFYACEKPELLGHSNHLLFVCQA